MLARKLIIAVLAVIVTTAIGSAALLYLAPRTATQLALDLERQRSGLAKHEIKLPYGLKYVYLDGGAGEPLLLLHGFGADKDNFTRVARFLTPHYRVIIPDHIGFGESSHPQDADYAPPAQAARLHALVEALGLAAISLGGSSMGGHIAMTYAAAYPAEVQSLWLLDPGGIWSAPASELRKQLQATGHNPLMARTPDEFAQIFHFVMSDPPFIPRPMLDVMAQARISNFALESRIFKQATADSAESRVQGLMTPTLIVFGTEDRAINPATAEILHGLMPKSSVIMMPGIGHLPMIEAPSRTADDYLNFRSHL